MKNVQSTLVFTVSLYFLSYDLGFYPSKVVSEFPRLSRALRFTFLPWCFVPPLPDGIPPPMCLYLPPRYSLGFGSRPPVTPCPVPIFLSLTEGSTVVSIPGPRGRTWGGTLKPVQGIEKTMSDGTLHPYWCSPTTLRFSVGSFSRVSSPPTVDRRGSRCGDVDGGLLKRNGKEWIHPGIYPRSSHSWVNHTSPRD